MKSFIHLSRRPVYWKCFQCDTEKTTFEQTYPRVFSWQLLFSKKLQAPLCPKCKKKMVRLKIFY